MRYVCYKVAQQLILLTECCRFVEFCFELKYTCCLQPSGPNLFCCDNGMTAFYHTHVQDRSCEVVTGIKFLKHRRLLRKNISNQLRQPAKKNQTN